MLLRLILCSLVFLVFFGACKKGSTITINNDYKQFTRFLEESNVKFEDVFEYEKGDVSDLKLLDTILVVFNSGNGKVLYRYNIKSKSYLGNGLIDVGRGPSEVLGGFGFGFNGSSWWIHDITLKKIVLLPKSHFYSDTLNFKEIAINDSYYQIKMLDDYRFLASGSGESSFKIQEINTKGKVLNEFGEFGKVQGGLSNKVLKDAMLSSIFLHPKKHRVAVPYRYQDVLEIYDLVPPFKCKAVQGPDMFPLEVKTKTWSNGHETMKKYDELRYAYDLLGDTTDDYIYLGYSGLTRKERSERKAWGGKSIFVYDWGGKPVKRLNLDRRITAFTVSQDNKIIYAYDTERGFIVKAAIK